VEDLLTAPNLIALFTLTALEIVLGIDNIVFIAILSGRLPPQRRNLARQVGLAGAMVTRILLLLSITWLMGLTRPWFTILGEEFSGKEVILLGGGLFLIAKSTHEIHSKLEGGGAESGAGRFGASMPAVIAQIMAMDIIFSLDSVITAVGMARALWVMVTAVIVAVIVMMVFARPISDFVERHPTIKMLALAFLILIGVMLVVEALDHEIPRGYIYFAMAFSLGVELLNLRMRAVSERVAIHQPRMPPPDRG
jgi:predicted tellurium resistance membrane protein TerC